MAAVKEGSVSGRDSADPVSLHVRGRAGAKGSVSSLCPLEGKNRKVVSVQWLLHWAYGRERVHLARPYGFGTVMRVNLRTSGRDSTLALGGGSGGGVNLGFEAPRDAYAVMDAVDAQGAIARLVRVHALSNGCPDWTPSPQVWVEPGDVVGTAVYDADGKPVLTRRGRRYISEFQMFAFRGDLPEIVAERRRVYGRWRAALRNVHRALSVGGALVAHELSAELPAECPWAVD